MRIQINVSKIRSGLIQTVHLGGGKRAGACVSTGGLPAL